uniref:Leucine-rich repeat-containing N-terminal plant-type domain-containing protein n=1 Tax=Salix viminalis TaxID=40686 RepID=A0A6N2MRJ3_SALVM
MALFNPFHGILLICMSFSLETATAATFLNVSDRLALLDFRKLITQDPHKIMSSWNDSIHFCNWVGINLLNNSFHGELPEELGRLSRLQHFNVSFNFFGGRIPTNLTHCTELTVLSVGGNTAYWGDSTPD